MIFFNLFEREYLFEGMALVAEELGVLISMDMYMTVIMYLVGRAKSKADARAKKAAQS